MLSDGSLGRRHRKVDASEFSILEGARPATEGTMRMSKKLYVCLSFGLMLGYTAGGPAAEDLSTKGCCVIWNDASRLVGVRDTQITDAQGCATFANVNSAKPTEYDFFPGRKCEQAIRCRDALCTNLSTEPIDPL
jgi:hypothetical protein